MQVSKEISRYMAELARRSNLKLTEAQKEARRNNAEKAREARKEKRATQDTDPC